MAKACSACGGSGWGNITADGYQDTKIPCPTCNPEGAGKPPAPHTPEPRETLSWADAPGKSKPGDAGEPASAFFSRQEQERQRQRDGG